MAEGKHTGAWAPSLTEAVEYITRVSGDIERLTEREVGEAIIAMEVVMRALGKRFAEVRS